MPQEKIVIVELNSLIYNHTPATICMKSLSPDRMVYAAALTLRIRGFKSWFNCADKTPKSLERLPTPASILLVKIT